MNNVDGFNPFIHLGNQNQGDAGSGQQGSVMFSLRALVARDTSTQAPAPRSERGPGVVDLSGLRARPGSVPDHVPVFPLGAPESARASKVAAPPRPARRSGVGGLVAGVAIAAAGIGFALGILRTAEARPATAATGIAAVTRALPAPIQAPPAEAPRPAAEPPAADVAQPKPAARAANQPAVRTQPAARPQPVPPKPAPKPAPPVDPCGGDLMCAMRRAAGR